MPKKPPNFNILQRKSRRFIFGTFGFCLGLFGIIYGMLWETICNRLLEKALILSPNSKIFEIWKNPPVTFTFDMYLFNWTNPNDFYNLSTKPILEEVGPYRYTDRPYKVDIKWHSENASVTYRKESNFTFDTEGSKGQLSDWIVTLNALSIAAASQTKRWSPMRRALADIALNLYNYELTLKKTVDELLFGGFKDPLLHIANLVPSSITNLNVPVDRFGYCYGRNATSLFSGVLNIQTGADDIRKLGQMHTWNNETSTKFYPPKCANVDGTPEIMPTDLKEHSTIDIFLPDLCRAISLDYVETVMVDGIRGFKYVAGLRLVDNGTLYPENACYCNGECVPSGLFNISSCLYDVPLFISYPHYYNADPYYADQVIGMKPDKEKHEFYIILEPRTGMALEFAGRIQANTYIEPVPYLSIFKKAPKMFFPLIWIEGVMKITPQLMLYLKIIDFTILGGRVFGAVCFVVGMIAFICNFIQILLIKQCPQHQIQINDMEKENEANTVKNTYSSIENLPFLK